LNSFTDVSNLDFGDVFGTQWFAIRWSDDCLCYHITLKEFFPIVVAIEIWGNQLRNKSPSVNEKDDQPLHCLYQQCEKL
jgi:hypothetical protein